MTLKQIKARYVNKLLERVVMIAREFAFKWKNYSFSFALYSTAWWLGWYCRPLLNKLCMWGFKQKTAYMTDYFTKRYSDVIEHYRSKECEATELIEKEKYPIWVFWGQGIDEAPSLVKLCYKQLVLTNGDSVKLITCANISEFVEIPLYIKEKVDSGLISLTHYSDIIRVSLLAKHGGLWVDATCWVSSRVPDSVRELPFYSCRSEGVAQLPLWSNSNWTGWGIGSGQKRSPLFSFVRDLLYAYHEREDVLVDYLLIDFSIYLAFTMCPNIAAIINELPANNQRRNELWYLLNKPYDEALYGDLISDTWLYKLSYKHLYVERSPDGRDTFYGKMLKGEL